MCAGVDELPWGVLAFVPYAQVLCSDTTDLIDERGCPLLLLQAARREHLLENPTTSEARELIAAEYGVEAPLKAQGSLVSMVSERSSPTTQGPLLGSQTQPTRCMY